MTKDEMNVILEGIKGFVTDSIAEQTPERKYADSINREGSKGDKEKLGFGKIMSTLARTKGDINRAISYAKSIGDSVLEKAMNEENFTSGGAFVINEFRGGELIELLRNASVIRKAQPRIIPLGKSGVITIPKITSGTTAHFLGELENAETTGIQTGNIRLSAKKLMAVVPVSNELLKDSSIGMEQQIIADLTAAFAQKEDQTALRGEGGENSFKGLRFLANAANVLTVTTATSPTTTQVVKDLYRMTTLMEENNIPGARYRFFICPRTEAYLKQIRDTSGQWIMANEMNERKTILGIPYLVTNNMPKNLGAGGDESEIILADMNEVLLATKEEIEISVIPFGAYYDGSQVVSGISNDSTTIVAHERLDFNVRRDTAIVVMTGAKNW